MRFYHRRQFERYQRCLDFIAQHSGEFGPKSQALKLKDQLQSVVNELGQSSHSSPKTPRTSSSQKQKANNELRESLGRIARTATAIHRADPSFKNTFHLPDKRKKNELAEAARRFLKDGEKAKDRFAEFDLRDDFLDDLRGKLDAYEAAQGSTKSAPRVKADPQGDSALIARGTEIMESLDTLMENRFHNDEKQLQDWQRASGIEVIKRGSRKKKASGGE